MKNIFESVKNIISKPQPTPSLAKGVVLSGGGSRAAFQLGALRALHDKGVITDSNIEVITGSSIGAVNGLVLAAGLNHGVGQSIDALYEIWGRRTFKNTFVGHPSKAFFRTIQIAILKYTSPGPSPSPISIFDPKPLQNEVDQVVAQFGGISIRNRKDSLKAVAVMATREDNVKRSSLLFVTSQKPFSSEDLVGATFQVHYVDSICAAHGFASAALPSVLPPVTIDINERQVQFVDGGISDNVPVDPAVRLGAEDMLVLDCSGRRWWFDHYGEPHYNRPTWEVPAAPDTFCRMPQRYFDCVNKEPFGPLLKAVVGKSRADFMKALGPTWPIFKILSMKMGSELAYEVMSYVALHPEYTQALIEAGYNRAISLVEKKYPAKL